MSRCAFLISILLCSSSAWAVEEKCTKKDSVLFLGSSTIDFWDTQKDFPDLSVENFGVWGTNYDDLIDGAAKWADECPAKQIVIYSGDNDVAKGLSPEVIADKFKQTAEILHGKLPQSEIFVVSIKPSPARIRKLSQIKKTNVMLRKTSKQLDYTAYVDIYSEMLKKDGPSLHYYYFGDSKDGARNDGLHMTKKGYALWAKVLNPFLHSDNITLARDITFLGENQDLSKVVQDSFSESTGCETMPNMQK